MTPKKLPNELLYEMVSSIKFHKKWSQIRVCGAFDHFLLGRMGHWLEKMKIVSEQCLSEVQTLCQLLLRVPGIFRYKGISMVRSKTDSHMAGLLSLFEGCNIPVLNWYDPPTLNFPRDIRARVGLPLAKDTPNYVNEMHAKFVQIVAIACQWPEATLTDLNILRNKVRTRISAINYQWAQNLAPPIQNDAMKILRVAVTEVELFCSLPTTTPEQLHEFGNFLREFGQHLHNAHGFTD